MIDEAEKLDVKLKRLKAAALTTLSRSMLNDLDLQVVADLLSDRIAARLTAHVWAEELETTAVYGYFPATWWDHLKRDAIPTFARLLRLSIKTKPYEVEFTEYMKYPEVRSELGEGRRLILPYRAGEVDDV